MYVMYVTHDNDYRKRAARLWISCQLMSCYDIMLCTGANQPGIYQTWLPLEDLKDKRQRIV